MSASLSSRSTSSSGGGSNALEIGNNHTGAEIWIYSKSLESFWSLRSTFESKSETCEGKEKKESDFNAYIPVFKHWILVAKFRGTTLWMEAFERGGVLQADFLDSEPDGIEEKCFVGKVNLSIKEMINLFNNSKLVGETYSLTGANCQSWIMGILEELGFKGNLTSINDVMVPVGAAVFGCGIGFGCALAVGVPLVAAGGLFSSSSSASASLIVGRSKKSNSFDSSKTKKT